MFKILFNLFFSRQRKLQKRAYQAITIFTETKRSLVTLNKDMDTEINRKKTIIMQAEEDVYSLERSVIKNSQIISKIEDIIGTES